MKKKGSVIIIIILMHLLICCLLSLGNVWSPNNTLLKFDFIQGFLLLYACTFPIMVSVSGIVDMLLGIFQKDSTYRKLRIGCGILGIFVLAMYVICNTNVIKEAWASGTEIVAMMYIGALVICSCWCVRVIISLRSRTKGKYSNAFKIAMSSVIVIFLLGVGFLFLDYKHTEYMNDVAAKVEKGMSYSQVVEIVGREGEIWSTDENVYSWTFGNNKCIYIQFSEAASSEEKVDMVVEAISKRYK